MLSYHADVEVKKKYQERFEAHRIADQVIQGQGFVKGRGCFVGCTLDRYDHSRFPIELGWPEWLARLADSIFEGLPKALAPQFGSDLLAAVPVGVNLEKVRPMLGVKRMDRLLALHANCDKYGLLEALRLVKALHLVEVTGVAESAELEARSAAESAALSAVWLAELAELAAWSAARSARSVAWSAGGGTLGAAAESVARSAESEELEARSAARSAESAAWSADASEARSAARSAESAARSADASEESAEESEGSAEESAESVAWSDMFMKERDDLLAVLLEMGA